MFTKIINENRESMKVHTIFEDGSMLLSSYGKVFHVTEEGKRMYDKDISFLCATGFKDGLAIVSDDVYNHYIIDTKGKAIHTEMYCYISEPENFISRVVDNNGYAYHVLVNMSGDNKIIPMYDTRFDSIDDFIDGIAIVSKNGKEYHIDINGKCIYTIPHGYDSVTEFVGDFAFATQGLNIHVINKQGTIISTRSALIE